MRKRVVDFLGFKPKTRAHDVIGGIIILDYSGDVKTARAYLNFYKNAETVVRKLSCTEGEFRVRNVQWLAGKKSFLTLHRENGCSFWVDVNKVFYTPRMGSERLRILNQVADGESVVDLFSGVGPFIITIAKFKHVSAFAVELNPSAFALLEKNVRLNKVDVACFNGDAKKVVNKLPKCDRVIMNLPKCSEDFLDCAFKISKSGTIIHFYNFSGVNDLFESHKSVIKERAKLNNFKVEFLDERKCGDIGVRQFRVVIDFRVI